MPQVVGLWLGATAGLLAYVLYVQHIMLSSLSCAGGCTLPGMPIALCRQSPNCHIASWGPGLQAVVVGAAAAGGCRLSLRQSFPLQFDNTTNIATHSTTPPYTEFDSEDVTRGSVSLQDPAL